MLDAKNEKKKKLVYDLVVVMLLMRKEKRQKSSIIFLMYFCEDLCIRFRLSVDMLYCCINTCFSIFILHIIWSVFVKLL